MATVNKDFRVKNGLVVEGTTATVNGNDILTTASTIGSDSIAEGTTNLFFTDARAIAAVGENLSIGNLSDVYNDVLTPSQGDVLTFDGQFWGASSIPAVNSTDDVSEGTTNLYFTNSRAVTAISEADIAPASVFVNSNMSINSSSIFLFSGDLTLGGGEGATNIQGQSITLDANTNVTGNLTVDDEAVLTTSDIIANTDGLSEGTSNLYFTDARAVAAVDGSTVTALTASENFLLDDGANHTAGFQIAENGTTSIYSNNGELQLSSSHSGVSLTASTDIYLTVDGQQGAVYINQEPAATQAYVNTAVSNLVDSAPGTLDTLNELAAALGDDPNFATTITNLIANQTTDGVAEGSSNLYFTNSRVIAAVSGADTLGDITVETITGAFGSVSVSGILQQSGTNAAYALQSYVDSAVSNATLDNTDELSEGTTNLYFTDARAVSAIAGETIAPSSIQLGGEYKTEITRFGVEGRGGTFTVGTLPEGYQAFKMVVSVLDTAYNDMEVSEVLVALKGSNAYITEYANVVTNDSVGSISVDSNGVVSYTETARGGSVSVEVVATALYTQSY